MSSVTNYLQLLKLLNEVEKTNHTPSNKVRFIHDGKIVEGEVFGQPYTPYLGFKYYHILYKNKVLDIPEHAIEEINR